MEKGLFLPEVTHQAKCKIRGRGYGSLRKTKLGRGSEVRTRIGENLEMRQRQKKVKRSGGGC